MERLSTVRSASPSPKSLCLSCLWRLCNSSNFNSNSSDIPMRSHKTLKSNPSFIPSAESILCTTFIVQYFSSMTFSEAFLDKVLIFLSDRDRQFLGALGVLHCPTSQLFYHSCSALLALLPTIQLNLICSLLIRLLPVAFQYTTPSVHSTGNATMV